MIYYVVIASIPDKAMKSMSNKALIHMHQDNFLNHQIKSLLKLNKKAKIIVVCSFESKKIIDSAIKSKRVAYVDHNYSEFSNVGESLKTAMQHVPDDASMHIVNLSMVIDPEIMKTIKFNKSSIIVSESKKFKSKIGCTINNTDVEYVFYDLPNKVCEYLHICKQDNLIFKDIIKTRVKNNMYLFEIINLLIENKVHIGMINTKNNIIHLHSLDQIMNIKYLLRKMDNNVNSI